jgi:hypothetical protein
MRKITFFLLILLPFLCGAQSLESLMDFSLDLAALADAEVSENAAAEGRIVVLEGLIKDIDVIRAGDIPEISLVLLDGAWIGTAEVRSYSCQIRFSGETWLRQFQLENSAESGAPLIPEGSRLLVAARVTGYDREKGQPNAEGLGMRVLR